MLTREETQLYQPRITKRWQWYHGLAFYVFVQFMSFGLGSIVKHWNKSRESSVSKPFVRTPENEQFYNRFKQPKFAPPSWAFAPVWTINNALNIWGLLHVLNKPKQTPGRDRFITLQGLFWADYVLFSAAYFGMRSPINAAVLTVTSLGLTVESVRVAVAELKDDQTVLSLSTLLPWLLIATPTALAIAAWNKDKFYDTGPFIKPSSDWVKEQ